MAEVSPDWIAEQQQAERQLIVRFDGLTELLLRLDLYVARADASAVALARMPAADASPRQKEADDLRRCAEIVGHYAANLDRVHLLEEPARRPSHAFGGRNTRA